MEESERIKEIRQYVGLSQQKFGEALGVHLNTVNGWEKGRINISPAMQYKIAGTFNINPMYLSGESDIMILPPDEDVELIDRYMENGNPVIKALLLSIVKKPDGWQMLADSILTAADMIRAAGIDQDEDKKKKP